MQWFTSMASRPRARKSTDSEINGLGNQRTRKSMNSKINGHEDQRTTVSVINALGNQ